MADDDPRLSADEWGVWREDRPGCPFGIRWDEIIGVSGYKDGYTLDGFSAMYTVIELEHPSGHLFTLHTDWPGFDDVAAAIAAHLPGIQQDWLAEIEQLQLREAPVTVWRKDS